MRVTTATGRTLTQAQDIPIHLRPVLTSRLADRFPLAALNEVKLELDPNNILGNTLVDTLLADSPPSAAAAA